MVARWQHGPRCRSTLRRDAPACLPGSAITAYRSEPMGHTRIESGFEMAGNAPPPRFNEDECELGGPESVASCVLPPCVPSVGVDMVSRAEWRAALKEVQDTACQAHVLASSAVIQTASCLELEHQNEELPSSISELAAAAAGAPCRQSEDRTSRGGSASAGGSPRLREAERGPGRTAAAARASGSTCLAQPP